MGRILSFHSNKRGQALIEFAFILPFLLVIVGGIVDFGPPILRVASAKIPDVGLFNGFTLESKFTDSPNLNEDAVQVTIEGQHGWFLLQLIGFEPITISRTAEMRWEWQ